MALLYLEYYPKGKKIIIQSTVIHPAVSHSREVVVWPLPLHHPSITVEEPSLLRWRVARGRTRPPYLTPNVHIRRLSDLLLPTSSPSSVWLAKMSQWFTASKLRPADLEEKKHHIIRGGGRFYERRWGVGEMLLEFLNDESVKSSWANSPCTSENALYHFDWNGISFLIVARWLIDYVGGDIGWARQRVVSAVFVIDASSQSQCLN